MVVTGGSAPPCDSARLHAPADPAAYGDQYGAQNTNDTCRHDVSFYWRDVPYVCPEPVLIIGQFKMRRILRKRARLWQVMYYCGTIFVMAGTRLF